MGTYHGAMSIRALEGLGGEVWICEIFRWSNWLTRALVFGLRGIGIEVAHVDSRLFVQAAVGRLLCSRVQRVFFPAYPPELEQGIAQTGYTVFFRSSVLENYMRKDLFPLNLLQPCELADGRLSESCASS
jgi:hypothetical protein